MIASRSSLFASILSMSITAGAALAGGQQVILGVDSGNDRVSIFDANDGSLINANFIPQGSGSDYEFSTPKEALRVGNEIWVTDQLEDSIFRFDLSGNYLSTIAGGLDNIRGASLIDGVVYVANGGSNNGAPGNAVVMFAADGTPMGNFAAQGSPWDIIESNGELLVTNSSNESIDRFDFSGAFQGELVSSDGTTGIDFPQQMFQRDNGNILVGGFSTPSGVYEYDSSGNQLDLFAEGTGARAALELGNGKYMFTQGDGFFVLDPGTDTFAGIAGASGSGFSGQFLNYATIPAPGALVVLRFGALGVRRRRRR